MTTHTLEAIVANCVITLNVVIAPDHSSLEIAYQFENQSDQPAIVFDMLGDPGQHPAMVEADTVAIWPTPPYLEIAKMAFPPPPDTLVESVYIPLGTIVLPGARHRDRFRISLPAKLWHPYHDPRDAQALDLAAIEGLLFRLGFVLTSDEFLAKVEITRLTDRDLVALRAFNLANQQVAQFPIRYPEIARLLQTR